MEKLIITVACDSRTSYPHNPLCPPQEDIRGVAQQYIDAVNAGAAIAHIHGRRTLEETIQADGRQVSRIHHEDWKRLQDAIMNEVDPIMQFGVASARIEEKIKLMELGPDMMAVCFNAHDEYFQPEPSLPPKRMMAIHPVEELIAYAKAAEEHKVKLESECFTTGAFWHLDFVRKQGYLREKTYTTLFIGWPGGTWTPPTERALQFMVDNLPQNCIWNVSVMNSEKQWPILALAVALGGHVRVGYEDNPYMAPGEFARNNAVLVERMVGIARSLGREVATPNEARKILGLTRAQCRSSMQTRRLGNSTLDVSVVGLGGNNFGGRIDFPAAERVVHAAIARGVNLIDTADSYGNRGGSEEALGRILGGKRKEIVLATKFGLPMDEAGMLRGASRRYIMQAVEASLKRLRTDWIDLYQLHRPDAQTPIEETLRALDDLVRQGKVRFIGCSNLSAQQVIAAQDTAHRHGLTAFVSCQDEYSLLVRDIERELIPAAKAHGLGILPYFPLASGLLTGKYRRGVGLPPGTRLAKNPRHAQEFINERNWRIVADLEAFAASRGRRMVELAVSWLLRDPAVAGVIAGAPTPEQVVQNVGAAARMLSAEDLAEIDRITS